MIPLPPCFPESSIPTESSSLHTREEQAHASEAEWQRFAELTDNELVWNADSVAQQRLHDTEAVQLETRGTTPQTQHTANTSKPKSAQAEFWKTQTTHKFSISAKLRSAGMLAEAEALEDCHSHFTVALCDDCGKTARFPNRCDRFYCPECQPGLAYDRKKQVEWWTNQLQQPKHVVLTVRNQPTLEAGHVDELRNWFTKLRRRKFCKNWTGGFYSMECTN
jgi:hypothetical protein